MKTQVTTIAAFAAVLICAAPAGAATYSFPVLWPQQQIMTGWHAFPSGSALTNVRNDGQLENEGALEDEGIEGWYMNESFTIENDLLIPLHGKVLSATVHAFVSAGCEPPACALPRETGRVVVGVSGPGIGAEAAIEGAGSGWISATQTFPATGPMTGDPSWEGVCPSDPYEQREHGLWEAELHPGEWLPRCFTRQQQIAMMQIGFTVTKFSRHERVQEAYVQLKVESP